MIYNLDVVLLLKYLMYVVGSDSLIDFKIKEAMYMFLAKISCL